MGVGFGHVKHILGHSRAQLLSKSCFFDHSVLDAPTFFHAIQVKVERTDQGGWWVCIAHMSITVAPCYKMQWRWEPLKNPWRPWSAVSLCLMKKCWIPCPFEHLHGWADPAWNLPKFLCHNLSRKKPPFVQAKASCQEIETLDPLVERPHNHHPTSSRPLMKMHENSCANDRTSWMQTLHLHQCVIWHAEETWISYPQSFFLHPSHVFSSWVVSQHCLADWGTCLSSMRVSQLSRRWWLRKGSRWRRQSARTRL